MSLGRTPNPNQTTFMASSREYCLGLPENSIYSLLHREGASLFPDEAFADLFSQTGRRGIPPHIVAVVMVLQRAEGLSDREAVDRFSYDLRWKYAAGGLDLSYPGFVHTVLVDMRARLRRSERPDRIFEAVLSVCQKAGLIGRKRVMDSTALYDSVATMDTVSLVRGGIRSLLRCKTLTPSVREELKSVLTREDDYERPGKPVCDWEDEEAKLALVDALAKDGLAILEKLEGRELGSELQEAAFLLATLIGQDLVKDEEEGTYRIRRCVASDRILSVVDSETRHGHKTKSRSFDGYKGHISICPDSEVITACDVTPGNMGDGEAAGPLLDEAIEHAKHSDGAECAVYGDGSYGTADIAEELEEENIKVMCKVQAPSNRDGLFTKSDFDIDLEARTVRCPQGVVVPIKRRANPEGYQFAFFGKKCKDCPWKAKCTSSKRGRLIRIHPKEKVLAKARAAQEKEEWKEEYKATRPKVERKIGHLMRHKHGGRRARMRGQRRVRDDFSLLCAAANLKRLAQLKLRSLHGRWTALAHQINPPAACGT